MRKNTVFMMETENKFAEKSQGNSCLGFGLPRMQLAAKATKLAKSYHLRTCFTSGILGKVCISRSGFMSKHPDIFLQFPTLL